MFSNSLLETIIPYFFILFNNVFSLFVGQSFISNISRTVNLSLFSIGICVFSNLNFNHSPVGIFLPLLLSNIYLICNYFNSALLALFNIVFAILRLSSICFFRYSISFIICGISNISSLCTISSRYNAPITALIAHWSRLKLPFNVN